MSLFSNLSEHVDPSPNTLDRSTVTGTPDCSSLRPRRRRQAPRAEDPPHRHRCVGAAPGGGARRTVAVSLSKKTMERRWREVSLTTEKTKMETEIAFSGDVSCSSSSSRWTNPVATAETGHRLRRCSSSVTASGDLGEGLGQGKTEKPRGRRSTASESPKMNDRY